MIYFILGGIMGITGTLAFVYLLAHMDDEPEGLRYYIEGITIKENANKD